MSKFFTIIFTIVFLATHSLQYTKVSILENSMVTVQIALGSGTVTNYYSPVNVTGSSSVNICNIILEEKSTKK